MLDTFHLDLRTTSYFSRSVFPLVLVGPSLARDVVRYFLVGDTDLVKCKHGIIVFEHSIFMDSEY